MSDRREQDLPERARARPAAGPPLSFMRRKTLYLTEEHGSWSADGKLFIRSASVAVVGEATL